MRVVSTLRDSHNYFKRPTKMLEHECWLESGTYGAQGCIKHYDMLNPAQAGIANATMALSTEVASVELASGISTRR